MTEHEIRVLKIYREALKAYNNACHSRNLAMTSLRTAERAMHTTFPDFRVERKPTAQDNTTLSALDAED